MDTHKLLLSGLFSNISSESLIASQKMIKELIKLGMSVTDIYPALETTFKLNSNQSRELVTIVISEIKFDNVYERDQALAQSIFFLFNQILENQKDARLLEAINSTLIVSKKDANGNEQLLYPGIDTTDYEQVHERIDLIGKNIERKKRLRDNILKFRVELNSLLRLKIDTDLLKAIQLLMTSDVLPHEVKNKLYDLFSTMDMEVATLMTYDKDKEPVTGDKSKNTLKSASLNNDKDDKLDIEI